jgi:DNA-binding response OmpR family regulator
MKPHILFVDDEAPTRELVSMFFRKKGYTVTTAVTADQGRALLDGDSFSLAVLDVDLAGENGMDLLSYCKTRVPSLPVVVFTGLNFDETLMDDARARGADGCMSKTQSLAELLAEVQRLLPAGPS